MAEMEVFTALSTQGVLKKPVVLSPWSFYEDYKAEASKATDSVTLQTMTWGVGNEAQLANQILIDAARRGLRSSLSFDHVALFSGTNVERLMPQLRRLGGRSSKEEQVYLEELDHNIKELTKARVNIRVTNPPNMIERVFPFVGRNHSKCGLIDEGTDHGVAYLMDFNIHKGDFDRLSFAIKFTDQPTVNAIATQYSMAKYTFSDGTTVDKRPENDLSIPCASDRQLLIDCGRPFQSRINQTALEIAQRSGPAIFATQYPLSGDIAIAIWQRALRNDPTLIVTSEKNRFHGLVRPISRSMASLFHTLIEQFNPLVETYYYTPGVHSKLLALIADPPVAEFSSNNKNAVGIAVGTQEYGILAKGDLARDIIDAHLRQIHQDGKTYGKKRPFENTEFETAYLPSAA